MLDCKCGEKIPKHGYEDHQGNHCPHRLLTCQHCGVDVLAKNMEVSGAGDQADLGTRTRNGDLPGSLRVLPPQQTSLLHAVAFRRWGQRPRTGACTQAAESLTPCSPRSGSGAKHSDSGVVRHSGSGVKHSDSGVVKHSGSGVVKHSVMHSGSRVKHSVGSGPVPARVASSALALSTCSSTAGLRFMSPQKAPSLNGQAFWSSGLPIVLEAHFTIAVSC